MKNTMTQIAKALGSLGGKKSAEVRFGGKTKSEISEIMKKVRLTSKQKAEVDEMMGESLQSLKDTIKEKI